MAGQSERDQQRLNRVRRFRSGGGGNGWLTDGTVPLLRQICSFNARRFGHYVSPREVHMLVSASEIRTVADWLIGDDPLRKGGRSSGYRWRSRILEKLGPAYDIKTPPPRGDTLCDLAQLVIRAVGSLDAGEHRHRADHWHIVAHVEDNYRWWGNKSWPPEVFVSRNLRPTRHKPVTFATAAEAQSALSDSLSIIKRRFGDEKPETFEVYGCECEYGSMAVERMPKPGPPRPSGTRIAMSLKPSLIFTGGEREKIQFERAIGAFAEGVSDFVRQHRLLEGYTAADISEALFNPESFTLKQLRWARTCLGGVPRTMAFQVPIGEATDGTTEFCYDFEAHVVSEGSL